MLVDFGLVKDLTTYQKSDDRGKAMGTPLYMSPDQARGEREVDFRSDIYSLAATMYHILTGEPPFGGLTAKEVIRKHMEDPFPAPRKVPIPVPDRMWEIIAKAMEKKPGNRYQSAKELKEALHQVSRSVAVDELKPRYTSQRKK
jgi:eukaryotic-like serine/threonine-protein kinase